MTDVPKKSDATQLDLDAVFGAIGEFRKRQVLHYVLLGIPVTLSCVMMFGFFFIAARLDYR